MKIGILKNVCLVLAISLTFFGSHAQAGGQCSKGVCSSGEKEQVDQERASSKMKTHTEGHKIISKLLAEGDRRPNREESARLAKLHDDHMKVVKKWVGVHHPQLEQGSDQFAAKVTEIMDEDQPDLESVAAARAQSRNRN